MNLRRLIHANIRGPRVTHNLPTSSFWKYVIGRTWLTVAGFETEGELPADGKAVMIANPHTSNWDLPYMLATAWVYRVKLSWLGKHTLFEGWGGPFMRWLGGIPVDRRAPKGQVAQVVEHIENMDEGILLAIAPSGTRSRRDHWKSGFYHIANGAQVPVVMSYLDFKHKKSGLGGAFVPTGDIVADMDRIRAFYDGMEGLHPEQQTPAVLREELETAPPESNEAPKATASGPREVGPMPLHAEPAAVG